jgi:tryptophan 2-monooxygenase
VSKIDPGAIEPVTIFGPDFPFPFDDWIRHPAGLGSIPAEKHGAEVAIIGAGISGLVTAYELMKLGLKPVVYEAAQLGGRLRSQPFEGADGIVAELGGMRFPISSTAFYHYVDRLGLDSRPFPNPLTPAAGSTVINLEGQTYYARSLADLPPLFQEVAQAYRAALEEHAHYSSLQQAIRERDVKSIKRIWDPLVRDWDERTFYDFVTTSSAFARLSFHHREVFGQVGFGTGGWDSDFPNSMLEILRVNVTECDDNQRLIVGGVEQVPQGIWRREPVRIQHWPPGTSLSRLHGGAPYPGVTQIKRRPDMRFDVTDRWGQLDPLAVVATCPSWRGHQHRHRRSIFSPKIWMALDRTLHAVIEDLRLVDQPFWKDRPRTGRDVMGMTLTDRLTHAPICSQRARQAGRHLPHLQLDERRRKCCRSVGKRVECSFILVRSIQVDLWHHRRSHHGLVGSRPALPGRLQGRAPRPLPIQSPHVRALLAAEPAAGRARRLHGGR